MTKILICIDDTDNLDSLGTGEILENMCEEMHTLGLGKAGFVTRHQLFIHEDIPYTSHNSSMCCEFETTDLEKTIAFAKQYLEENCAEGSDPGLCIYCDNQTEQTLLKEFGLKAKQEIAKKDDAYKLAESYPNEIYLSEHGGTGIGVIGAIAGIGLRLTGMDGRIKGKIYPQVKGEKMTVREFLDKYNIGQAITDDGQRISEEEIVVFTKPTKAVLHENKITCIMIKEDDHLIPKPKELKDKNK